MLISRIIQDQVGFNYSSKADAPSSYTGNHNQDHNKDHYSHLAIGDKTVTTLVDTFTSGQFINVRAMTSGLFKGWLFVVKRFSE